MARKKNKEFIYKKGMYNPDDEKYKVTFNGGTWNATPLKGAEANTKGLLKE